MKNKRFFLRNEDIAMFYTAEDMPSGFIMIDFVREMKKFIVKSDDSVLEVAKKISFYLHRDVKGIKYSMIVAGYDEGVPFVYLLSDETVKILNRNAEGNIIYRVTIGGNLKRVNQYFDFDKSVNDLLLDEALEHATEIVRDSIDWLNDQDEYSDVGGSIQSLAIKPNGSAQLINF